MKNKKVIIGIVLGLLVVLGVVLWCVLSCGHKKDKETDHSLAETSTTETSALQQTEETEEVKWYYEAIFLDNDEISKLFADVRGEAPFEHVTEDFHVTTAFMPETTHPQWYGEKVTVTITAYKSQMLVDDHGNMTANEGFKAYVSSDNPELQAYLDSLNKNFHITGAYTDEAKYTENIDFSDGEKIEYTTTGTFGCGDYLGNIVLE